MNLFLTTSPFQLICAIEAKKQYQTTNNILLIRDEKNPSAQQQIQLLLNSEDWDAIHVIGRKSKIWEARKIHSFLKKHNCTLQFEHFFFADYSAWRTNVILNNIHCKNEVMIDDGVGTLREFNDKIHPEIHVSRNKNSRDLLLKLCGLAPPRVIYPRTNFSFFTFFQLPLSNYPVKVNHLEVLKKNLNALEHFCPQSKAGFIGQGMVAEKGINLDYYVQLLTRLLKKHPQGIIYFPHRTEAAFVKERLLQVEGITYHDSRFPLELEIAKANLKLSAIYGIASTASITIQKIYTNIPVFDIVVNPKHYVIEEFGNNFMNVAKILPLKSITLDSD